MWVRVFKFFPHLILQCKYWLLICLHIAASKHSYYLLQVFFQHFCHHVPSYSRLELPVTAVVNVAMAALSRNEVSFVARVQAAAFMAIITHHLPVLFPFCFNARSSAMLWAPCPSPSSRQRRCEPSALSDVRRLVYWITSETQLRMVSTILPWVRLRNTMCEYRAIVSLCRHPRVPSRIMKGLRVRVVCFHDDAARA